MQQSARGRHRLAARLVFGMRLWVRELWLRPVLHARIDVCLKGRPISTDSQTVVVFFFCYFWNFVGGQGIQPMRCCVPWGSRSGVGARRVQRLPCRQQALCDDPLHPFLQELLEIRH